MTRPLPATKLCKPARFVLFALLIALFSSLAYAGTWVPFGPQTYVRGTGAPVTVTSVFSVLNPSTQYTLHVVNGGLGDSTTELASATVIAINGVEVVGPNNFNRSTAVLDVPIVLQYSNTLAVQLKGKPGGVISVQIIGVDNDPPVISASLSQLPNAAGWNNSNVTVGSACSDQTSGVAFCPPPVLVSTEGANQVISSIAKDKAGNTATTSVTVNLDKTPPKIVATINPPPDAAGWNSSSVTVNFSCADALSGLAACSSPVAVTSAGAGQLVTGATTDVAGNPATTSVQVNISFNFFQIRNYAGKCLDYDAAAVFLNDCPSAHPVRVEEINDRHEVVLHVGRSVIGIHNPPVITQGGPPPLPQTEYALELQTYNPILATTANQVFRLDGDSIILESRLPCLNSDATTNATLCPPPAPQLVVRIQNARGANGSPLVAGLRNLADAEFWDFNAIDGSGRYPTSGFVPVATNYDLWNALCTPMVARNLSTSLPVIDDPGQPDNGTYLHPNVPCSAKVGWGSVVIVTGGDQDECTGNNPNIGACIDLSLYPPITLPAGVTLRGNRRGTNLGPQLFSFHPGVGGSPFFHCGSCMVEMLGDYTRVTGLRLRGAFRYTTFGNYTTAIQVGFPGPVLGAPPFSPTTMTEYIATVDHNDISDWGESGVSVATPYSFNPDDQTCTYTGYVGPNNSYPCGTSVPGPSGALVPIANDPGTLANVRVAGNFLHHNELDSGGYGVVVGRASIERNTFLMNRHAITASGEPHNEYRASYNLVQSSAPQYTGFCFLGFCHDYYNQDFDMHGTEDKSHWYNGQGGYHTDIVGNTFLATNRENFELRGFPSLDADFHFNISLESQDSAVNFKICANVCIQSYIVPMSVFANRFNSNNPTDHLAAGDFDADGDQDLFLATGTAWYFSPAGNAEWRFLSAKTDSIDTLLLGDLDGDGRTDVLGINGSNLMVSWGGASEWEVLNTLPAGASITDLAVGDFNGDGHLDIFYADGTNWLVSYGGSGPFVAVNTSGFRKKDLLFGDFDGDGKTDVFGVLNAGWQFSSGGTSGWSPLPGSVSLTNTSNGLVVADFNGDGRADVAMSTPTVGFAGVTGWTWMIWYNGSANWTSQSCSIGIPADPFCVPLSSAVGFGNFDGNAGADILLWKDVNVWIASGGFGVPQRLSAQDMR